jgi:hypothetical protein
MAGKLRSRKAIAARTADMPEEAVMSFRSDFLPHGATLPKPNPPAGDDTGARLIRNPRFPSAVDLRIFLLATMVVALSCLLDAKIALSQGVELVKVDLSLVAKGYRASKLIGHTVTNDKNETIGAINDLIMDHKDVMFAVLEVGGFLGIGAHLVVVPYDSLVLDETGSKVELPGATKEQLKGLSQFHYQS